ncbi:hypothetical protein [Rubrivirga marina]|uniref:Sel1 repeat family protein n=1 Tax=Rubrivirga marina TaxID=1196024 RepID=A0A271J3V0_9BACT|nr:hypothetical protein [Rubrivirga marina]PAP77958.1 hypothetical protein BSZ37_16685 [Rubrivirga marina]
MVRLSILCLLLLAACRPAPSGLTPHEAALAHLDALRAGDADRALALLDEAAEAGHLEALHILAHAHGRGYLQTPYDSVQKSTSHLPIFSTRWEAGRALRRFERALRDSVRAGSVEAQFLVADRLLGTRRIPGARDEVDPDSARALYHTLAARDADPLRLAFLANRLGDDEAYLAHLDDAAEAGDPNACVFRYWRRRDRDARFSAAGVAREIDALEACRARALEAHHDAEMFTSGERVVGDLAAQAREGNAEATATLDSLRATGVFDRHPRLAPLADAGVPG